MKEVPPLPGEEKIYEWINSVLVFAARRLSRRELIQPMTRWHYNGHWTSPDNLGAFGIDYIPTSIVQA